MCCFSGNVQSVSNTRIFARSSVEGRQFLVYEMTFSAREDLAMILPIPVPPGSPEDAVRFLSLKDYPEFFGDLQKGFPAPQVATPKAEDGSPSPAQAPRLKVVEVGSFEASFVPAVKDFSRLDARFRLPEAVWANLPAYKDFGFAVFKLKKGGGAVHPMAFEFPRRAPAELFLPTVHIHDGKVHDRAAFDHALYCQKGTDEGWNVLEWEESPGHASGFMNLEKASGLVVGAAHVYRRDLRGEAKNEDTILKPAQEK
jgi:hypothetical protein